MKIRNEKDMSKCVMKSLQTSHKVPKLKCDAAVCEFQFQRFFFDVVGYSKSEKVFYVVECKKGSKATTIGHAFGQILAYKSLLGEKGYEFLEEFHDRLIRDRVRQIKFHDLEQAKEGENLRVKFYVALGEEACNRYDLIRLMKNSLGFKVGIIRVRNNGKCRFYIRTDEKANDTKICASEIILVPISTYDLDLERVLERRKSNKTVKEILYEFSKRIAEETRGARRMRHDGFVYKSSRNFVHVHARKKHVILSLYKNKKRLRDPRNLIFRQPKRRAWVRTKTIDSLGKIAYAFSLIRQAFRISEK